MVYIEWNRTIPQHYCSRSSRQADITNSVNHIPLPLNSMHRPREGWTRLKIKEVMAATLEDFANRICKDRLDRGKFVNRFQRFLSKVDLPDDWEDSNGYVLQDTLPTYKHRYNCLRNYVEQAEAKSMTVDQLEDFVKKIENAALSPLETEKSFINSSIQESHKNQPFDLFEQNIKVRGVVMRKCEKKLKASILTKKKDPSKQKFSLNELVMNIQDTSKSGGGFQLNVGDVIEVTKCRRKEGMALDAQLIKYARSVLSSFFAK